MTPLPAKCARCGKRVYYREESMPASNGTKTDETACAVSGCGAKATSRGWCGKHYARWYRWGNPPARTTALRRGLRWCDPDGVAHKCVPKPNKYSANGVGSIAKKGPRAGDEPAGDRARPLVRGAESMDTTERAGRGVVR